MLVSRHIWGQERDESGHMTLWNSHMIWSHDFATHRPCEDVVFHPYVRVESRPRVSADPWRRPTHPTNSVPAIVVV